MPRKLRIQYPGAMYHVMNRGDQRENVFGPTSRTCCMKRLGTEFVSIVRTDTNGA
jgi:hypothetical protein